MGLPSPFGRGAGGEGPVKAYHLAPPVPSPALAGTLSRRERENHTDRVATTGGTAAARSAGPSTASWPMAHSASAPTGK